MRGPESYRPGFWKGTFYLLLATGIALTVVRFALGLGAVTNLSDAFPWGLWVGFDVLCGVGLAAGGFTAASLSPLSWCSRLSGLPPPSPP